MRKIKLFPHNKTAYEKAVKMLNEKGKAAIVHPTGTGKSFIAFALARDNSSKKFLWLSPSKYIYDLQCKNLWQSQHIKLTNIDFHTYSWLMLNEWKIKELKPDYIILDEFHRTGADKWGRSVRKLIKALPNSKILGLSATKVRYLDDQRDMAVELFDGCIASEIGFCEAIALGILPKPKYIIASYTYEAKLQEYMTRTESLDNQYRKAEAEKLIEKLRHKLQKAKGMDKIFKKYLPKKNARIIVFCSSLDHMMEVMAQIPEWFSGIDCRPHVYQVSSNNPESEEDFLSFAGDESEHLKLLYCVDMLNEGIHVSDVDAVVLCRPTTSPVIYKQQIGRGIAVGSKRKPIIFDVVNNIDSLYQINAFEQELTGEKESLKTTEIVENESEDDLGFEIIDELYECREMFEQLHRNLNASWDVYYQELCRYAEEHGDANVPKCYKTEGGLCLGVWLVRQRSLYRKGLLGAVEIYALDKITISWDYNYNQINKANRVDKNMEHFKEYLTVYKKYRSEGGDRIVPYSYITEDGVHLGSWCSQIRSQYLRGRLRKEKVQLLKEAGFYFHKFTYTWYMRYEEAKQYYEANGDINIKQPYIDKYGGKLNKWVKEQKKEYLKEKHGNLNKDQIKLLEMLHIAGEYKLDVRFIKGLKAFKQYIKQNDSVLVPSVYKTADGYGLGKWLGKQKNNYNKGRLSENKFRALDDLGMEWGNMRTAKSQEQWDTMYNEALKYAADNGTLSNLPSDYVTKDGKKLGRWVRQQKKIVKNITKEFWNMTNKMIIKLDFIGIK